MSAKDKQLSDTVDRLVNLRNLFKDIAEKGQTVRITPESFNTFVVTLNGALELIGEARRAKSKKG